MIDVKKLHIPSIKVKRFVASQYLIGAFCWCMLIAGLIVGLILFLNEKSAINNSDNYTTLINNYFNSPAGDEKNEIAKQLLQISYPIIDFSLMVFSFIKITNYSGVDPSAAWDQRSTDISAAYSYIFITVMIAMIGLAFYISIIVKLFRSYWFNKRYNLETAFSHDYVIFNNRIYLNFVLSLTIAFAFFNFLTTIIVVGYGIVLVLLSYFMWYVLNIRNEILTQRKWWASPNFVLYASILIIQNGYTLLKAYFSVQWGVNLDLILKIILPIGTITVIITLLIKNMLSTKVTAVRNEIKNINSKVSAFRIFYHTQNIKALEDFDFVGKLPPLIKNPLENKDIDARQAVELMAVIDDTTNFIKGHFTNKKEVSYLLFHLYNEITDMREIVEIRENTLKIEAQKTKKSKIILP